MNWHQIGSQILSTLIAGAVAAGPLGLAAKFYLDRSLKRLDASAAERLEKMKDELSQKRDSRQALINQSTYAAQKAFEIEFQAIQDIDAALDRLLSAIAAVMPFPGLLNNATPEQKKERLSKAARELTDAHKAVLDLLRLRRLYLPQAVDEAVHACIGAITRELPIMFTDEGPSTDEERAQARI
jgi:hypothetical protein